MLNKVLKKLVSGILNRCKIFLFRLMQKTIKIESFSEHLFGDIDRKKLDFEKNKHFIIERILDTMV